MLILKQTIVGQEDKKFFIVFFVLVLTLAEVGYIGGVPLLDKHQHFVRAVAWTGCSPGCETGQNKDELEDT